MALLFAQFLQAIFLVKANRLRQRPLYFCLDGRVVASLRPREIDLGKGESSCVDLGLLL
jgi:hypothetical protein